MLIKILLIFSVWLNSSIYDLKLTDINGAETDLTIYRGKKILFVNTASKSQYVNQYSSLEQLYEKYSDSVVVIAIPSNSFSNEFSSNDSIKDFVVNTYNIKYVLGAKADVTGDSIASIYQWLTDSSLNHRFENAVNGDFFKFLVDENGNLEAIFDETIDPMDDRIQHLIQNQ